MSKVIKQYTIARNLDAVYHALTDTEMIEKWSGSEAIMELTKNGVFSLWGGEIVGINKQISKIKIVQDWKESTWDTYSLCTFNLTSNGDETCLELIHENIPAGSVKSIDNGWDDYYLGPLKELVEIS